MSVGKRGPSSSDEQRSSRVAEVDFADAFDEFRQRLIARLRRELPHDRVEDVVQETFARALRARDQFDVERPMWPWLLAIAQHLVIDIRRHDSARPEVLTAINEDVESPAVENPEGVYLYHEFAEELDAALSCLIPRQRRVLELRNRGWSYQELASIEDMTIVGVKSLLCRARRMARVAYIEITEDGRRVVVGLPALRWVGCRLRRAAGRAARAIGRLADPASVGGAAGYLSAITVSAVVIVASSGATAMPARATRASEMLRTSIAVTTMSASQPRSAPVGRGSAPDRHHRLETQSPGTVAFSVQRSQGARDSVSGHVATHAAGHEPYSSSQLDFPCRGVVFQTGCRVLAHLPGASTTAP